MDEPTNQDEAFEAQYESFEAQCEGQGGTVYGDYCEYPGDPLGDCLCSEYPEWRLPSEPPVLTLTEGTTYAGCMGGGQGIDQYCSWH